MKVSPEALVGQFIELDRMYCVVNQYNPTWSQLKYEILLPEERGERRRLRADIHIDPESISFIGPDGRTHKCSMFNVDDLIRSEERVDADFDSKKLLTAAHVLAGTGKYDLVEKCISTGISISESSKRDTRLMDFVREIMISEIKHKLATGDADARQEVTSKALACTSALPEDIAMCLGTAQALHEHKLLCDAIALSSHTLELLHTAMEVEKSDPKNISDKYLRRMLRDTHSLRNSLQVDRARECDQSDTSLRVIEEYFRAQQVVLKSEFDRFGIKSFLPVHGESIVNSVLVSMLFWEMKALLQINQVNSIPSRVSSIFSCMNDLSMEEFDNVVMDYIYFYGKYTKHLDKTLGEGSSASSNTLRSETASMVQGVINSSALSDVQLASFLSKVGSTIMNHDGLLPLARKYLERSLALAEQLIEAGSGEEGGGLTPTEPKTASSECEGEYEYECEAYGREPPGVSPVQTIKRNCDKSMVKLFTLELAEAVRETSLLAVAEASVTDEGVRGTIRSLVEERVPAVSGEDTDDFHHRCAERFLVISKALFTPCDATCPASETERSFQRRTFCLNFVASEYAQQAVDESSKVGSASPEATRHKDLCAKNLVREGDVMAVFDQSDGRFLCFVQVMRKEYGFLNMLAGVHLNKALPTDSALPVLEEYVQVLVRSLDRVKCSLVVAPSEGERGPMTYRIECINFHAQWEDLISGTDPKECLEEINSFLVKVISFNMGVKNRWEVYRWVEMGRSLSPCFDNTLSELLPRLDPAQILIDAIKSKVDGGCTAEALDLLRLDCFPPPDQESRLQALLQTTTCQTDVIAPSDSQICTLKEVSCRYLQAGSRAVKVSMLDTAGPYLAAAWEGFLCLREWDKMREVAEVSDESFNQKLKALEGYGREQEEVISFLSVLRGMAEEAVDIWRFVVGAMTEDGGCSVEEDRFYHSRAVQKFSRLERICLECAEKHTHTAIEVEYWEGMVLARDRAMRLVMHDDDFPVVDVSALFGSQYYAEAVRQVCMGDSDSFMFLAMKLISGSFDTLAKGLPQCDSERVGTVGGAGSAKYKSKSGLSEEDILRGATDSQLAPLSRSINVFISSTFTDTVLEYDVILDLLPEITALAAQHHIEFAISTMRWGVTDAAFDDNLTSLLCMQEIRRCATVTCPGSVCFLSLYNTKLGYRPLPLDIPLGEYELICDALSNMGEKEDQYGLELLKQWYLLDSNKVPAAYRLQPKSALLQQSNDWWALESVLVCALRQAVDKLSLHDGGDKCEGDGRQHLLPADRKRVYFQSVTEEEIQVGLELAESSRKRAFLFTREIIDIDAHLEDKAAARYVDMLQPGPDGRPGCRDEEARVRNSAVTGRGGLLERLLPPSHVHRAEVTWDSAMGVDKDGQQVYTDQLSKQMKQMFMASIQDTAEVIAQWPSSPSYHEALQHACITQQNQKCFVGREKELARIANYLTLSSSAATKSGEGTSEGARRKVLVVVGDVGVGKSSLLARAAARAADGDIGSNSGFVVVRYCGATPLSSSLVDVLRSTLCQLLRARGGIENSIADTFEQLSRSFLLELGVLASAEAPVYVFLDGLDQLSVDLAQRLWLHALLTQEKLPAHVYVIVSTLYDPTSNLLSDWTRDSLEADGNIFLPPFCPSDLSALLQLTLRSEKRNITPDQAEELRLAVSTDNRPLSFAVAWLAARSWPSSLSEDKARLSRGGTAGLMEDFLHNMERKYDSFPGPSLIGKLTTLIALTRSGASSFELESQVGRDSVLMEVLQKWWKLPTSTHMNMPPGLLPRITAEFGSSVLRESTAQGSTVLRFMNSLFETVVLRRYIPQPEEERLAREEIVAFFGIETCLVSLPRRAVVVVDQLLQLKAFDRAREFILQKEVFYGYAVEDSQRTWLLGVFRATGGYAGLPEMMKGQLDDITATTEKTVTEMEGGGDDGQGDGSSSQRGAMHLSRAEQCTTLAKLFLDMEFYEEAWEAACEAVQLLETLLPSSLLASAYDVSSITSQEALQHIATPATAPLLGPSVIDMPHDWRRSYAAANEMKIKAGSLFYDTLESIPDKYKEVATAVLILSRRVVEIWADDKESKGYGVALTLAARMSYKQNIIGPVFLDRAIELLLEAVPLLINTCGELSVEVGDALYWLGEAYLEKATHNMGLFNRKPELKDMSIGLSSLFAAERVFKICHGSIHKRVGMVLSTIAVALCKCGEYRTSEQYFRKSTDITEVVSGADSVATATALLGLTGVLTMQGICNQGTLDVLERAKGIFEKMYGANYERTVNVQKAIDAVKKEISAKTNSQARK